jgi:hypothetical protein
MEEPVRYLPIRRAEGYRVGDDGSVWSRRVPGPGGLRDRWKPLKIQEDRHTGYARVTLRIDGKTVHRNVHRLVLEAFVGPCPDGMEACHFPDPNRMNCRLDNLRWDTRIANQNDKVAHGTSNRGSRQHMAKLSEPDVLDMLQIERGVPESTYEDLAMLFGVTKPTVANIFQGHNWGWLTGIPKGARRRGPRPRGSRKSYRDLGPPGE